MKRTFFLILLAGCASSGGPVVTGGVSRSLAQHRARTLSDIRYKVGFVIPESKEKPIKGTVEISFSLEGSGPVVLDFDPPSDFVESVHTAQGTVAAEIRDGHIILPAGALRPGRNVIVVYFTAGDRGTQNVHHASLNGQVRQVTEGVHMFSLSSISDGGKAAGTRTSYQLPGDVVHIDLKRGGEINQLTRVNEDVLGDKRLGEVEEVWYTSTDETRVQGWIVKPPDFDASSRYPLILHIHGGPHAMYNVSFSYFYQNLAANGYVVLYTNPRGSTGYGTAFGNAIDKAYPSVDHEDLMAGVDELEGRGFVDADRLYVTGCSGGGVLSSWAIGQTDRFAAASVRCPVINWISFAGTADIVQWGYHRFDGYFWENPDKWLEHSPLMHVGKVTTPTLLMTGELDLRTPMSQTEEYYAALKVMGVETVMLRFNNEYHGTTRTPSNYMRTLLYLVDWFGDHDKRDREKKASTGRSSSTTAAASSPSAGPCLNP